MMEIGELSFCLFWVVFWRKCFVVLNKGNNQLYFNRIALKTEFLMKKDAKAKSLAPKR